MMDLHEAPLLEKSAQAEENITTENVSLPETAKENKLVENKLSREEIVARVKELVDQPVESVKDEIDSLKQNYYKLRKNEVEEARRKFEEETGDTSGFTPEPDECEETLKGLLNVFKEKKAKLLEQHEKVKEENLLRKKSILEEIKKITEDSDNINKHYNDFQQLQQAFKEITDVPASAVNELWKNYQLYVEHFYDLLKINKEMNITIVVVTHQMEVIKQICNKVTFLKDGRVLSVGKPEELFVAPNQEIQKFVGDDIEILPQTGKNIKLFFTNNNSKSHTITQLARTLDINFDICQGKLENFRGSMMGSLIINIDEKDLQAVENYLDQEKITWEEIV